MEDIKKTGNNNTDHEIIAGLKIQHHHKVFVLSTIIVVLIIAFNEILK